MKLTKRMIQAFKQIIHGAATMDSLASALEISPNRISEVVSDLEEEYFVVKTKGKGKNRISIEIAGTEHALRLRDAMVEHRTIKFEEIIANSKLLFLAALSEDWINIKEAAKLSGISQDMIRKYKLQLQNRGLFAKEKAMYMMNDRMWPKLRKFILAYKNYAPIKGAVKWRFQDEILFEVDDESLLQGTPTGLFVYKNYGVKMWVVSALCYLPKRKLSKEEVFVHSLFKVDEPRILNVALTFYLKNRLNYKKVLPLAMKYGKYTLFTKMVTLLDRKEKKVKLEGLPVFDRIDFYRIATMYDVKGLEDPGPYDQAVRRGFAHVRS